jgi:hypothetical protein
VSANVLIVAKAPIPGRAKTRLVPPLSAGQAAMLQEALLLDTLEACLAEVPDTALLHADAAEAALLSRLVGPDVPLVLQEGRGLGDALRLGMARRLVNGPTALVSSDIPGLPAGALSRAFALLEEGSNGAKRRDSRSRRSIPGATSTHPSTSPSCFDTQTTCTRRARFRRSRQSPKTGPCSTRWRLGSTRAGS